MVTGNKTVSNTSNTRDSVSSGYLNTEKRVRHAAEYFLFYILSIEKNKLLRVNGEVKSSKSMLIKTGYPNLLHGGDFRCFNLMNY